MMMLITAAFIVISVKIYYWWSFGYWKRKDTYSLPPSIPFGNIDQLLKNNISLSSLIKSAYEEITRKNLIHGGMYFLTKPVYVPVDPDIIKHVLQKDFEHFVNRGAYFNEEDDPLSAHLFNIEDAKWKSLRAKLSPTFTSGKMKMMFQTVLDCTKNLTKAIDIAKNGAIDIKDVSARFTTDVIGACAFGLECNSFGHLNAPFRTAGKRMFEPTVWENFKFFMSLIFPRKLLQFLRMVINDRSVIDFFTNVVKETISYRGKNNIFRKDFVQLLMELGETKNGEMNGEASTKINLTFKEVTAQAFLFFAAGFETSATTMMFALFELAKNPNIQEKLRQEIKNTLKKHTHFTYETIMKMQYLDNVVNETLRKYPPLGFLHRTCNKDYKIPKSGLVLQKGTLLFVSVEGLHHDAKYYPNPTKFDPDRFTEEIKNKRPPFTYLPFGGGPRICIGLRFGLLQAKVGLVSLLSKYTFIVDAKTEYPIKIDPRSFISFVEKGIYLRAHECMQE